MIAEEYWGLKIEMQDLLKKANEEKRSLTEEEKAKFDELDKQMIEILENL